MSEFSISNLNEVEVAPWERLGARGAMIVLQGAEDANNAYVLEISGGGSVKPERHLYEEIVYVLSGRGATTVWDEGGPKRTFEWHEGSLFAIPLNAWHQFFNGQGSEAARFYVVSSAPLVMNLYHNLDFVFNCGFNFTDRFDARQDFFNAEGQDLGGRVWETNFVEDVRTFRWGSRKYPLFKNVGKRGQSDVSVKEGGNQIEYEDEDASIRKLFEQELARNGVECRMASILSR